MFQMNVAQGKDPNYLHELKYDSARLLEQGGLWKYSNDSHETVQNLAKNIYMLFSARGAEGNNRSDPLQIIHERHFMRTHVCTIDDGPRYLFMLKSEQRKLEEMKKLMDAVDIFA